MQMHVHKHHLQHLHALQLTIKFLTGAQCSERFNALMSLDVVMLVQGALQGQQSHQRHRRRKLLRDHRLDGAEAPLLRPLRPGIGLGVQEARRDLTSLGGRREAHEVLARRAAQAQVQGVCRRFRFRLLRAAVHARGRWLLRRRPEQDPELPRLDARRQRRRLGAGLGRDAGRREGLF